MTTATEEKKVIIWTKEEKDNFKSKYGTEILVEDGSYEDVIITQAPTDAYIIKYVHDDQVRYDLTRGTKIKLFDMYWDKFKGGIKSIEYGKGSIKPNLWGYQSPKPPKKKRKA